ncbi:helicase-related protein [Caldimonas tepidiphila]|uniref:helicase-related protein n=1 Tax=Caldimonas tepidiphila TaxID=2315841 RepID=UPI000E5A2894|nr:helicase-related protein [Caldimonas tepidiphila]
MSTPASPEKDPLPEPAHRARVPSHLTNAQLRQLRKAAFHLPQAVQPSDFPGVGRGEEDELERRGLVLLQPPVEGTRASRWIAPQLMDAALRHLEPLRSVKEARSVMSDRGEALEQLGLRRVGLDWTRVCHDELTLPFAGWRLRVAHVEPMDGEPVWDFYRTGDTPVLLDVLERHQPPHPRAAELTGFLDGLAAQAHETDPLRMDLLLPALQAECDRPVEPEALKAACQRAYARWARHSTELSALSELNSALAFQGYPDSFPLARRLGRKVSLFVGPPNSGKTHGAFERLARAGSGTYLAPLRLLALEGRDRLEARGVPCSLLTGEENVPSPGARAVSSTVEMVNTGEVVDVAVIDEAQMLFDKDRGWAWTQAIVGVPARELLIICSAYAEPAVRSLLGVCGEACETVEFKRKQHVQLLKTPVPLKSVTKGDAVVAFSRRDVLMLRDEIAQRGHTVSVIYGALPPEVRRNEAERFAGEEADILVATDAIGMGLNLPIRRVLFSTMEKFDGVTERELNESEVHQIAGRAGRFGIHEEGFTGVLDEAEPTAAKVLRTQLAKQPRAPLDFKAFVAPNRWHVETIAMRLGKTRLRSVLAVFMEQLKLDSSHFEVAELEQMLELAEMLDRSAARLELRDRFIYAQAPLDTRAAAQVEHYLGWAQQHATRGRAGEPLFLEDVGEYSRLDMQEQALKLCTLWLWLDMRFPGVYGHVEEVVELRRSLNRGIERQLKSKKPLWRARRGGGGRR